MKTRRIFASILVLCLLLCCMSVTALAAEAETIALGESKTVTVSANESEYTEGELVYSFTPDESGTYVFVVDYTASEDLMHLVLLYTGDGEDAVADKYILEAEAGTTYELKATYWGMYTEDVDYVFSVEKCLPLEGIELSAESDSGLAEEYLYIDVIWQPSNSAPEAITWESSDTSVAEISYEDTGYVELYLVAPGTATITATTVSGKTASVEITVEESAPVLELTEGENPVSVPVDEVCQFVFTPEVSGYYVVAVDNDMVGCWLSADSVSDGTNDYYVLEAGVTYEGELYNWTEEDIDCAVLIEYAEDVVILDPVTIELVKLPDNTTYLKDTLYDVWSDDKLSGMELKVTWSDGSVSDWSYDENFGFIGSGYVGGFLNEKDDGGFEVEVYASVGEVEPVFFDLTVLDITAESVALVDDTPLEIVEYSCGLDLSTLGVGVEGWYYLPFAAYNREVVITFSDGSTVKAVPGDVVYGVEVTCRDNQGGLVVRSTQPEGFWTKESENLIGYGYGDLYTVLTVQIIDSPVESIEVIEMPQDTFMIDEELGLIAPDGKPVETVRQLYDGMSLKVNYKDGTSKTFAAEDIEWCDMMGIEYPFVDGYPVGVFGGWMMMEEAPVAPCDIEGYLEYMGVSTTYTIHIVEEFENDDDTDKPDIEINPDTGDNGLLMAVFLISVLGAAVIVLKNEKVIG